MLRVLISDDSALARETLETIINEDPEMMVAGVAENGTEAVKKAEELRPDLITMDLLMPDIDGVEATRRIMVRRPAPIVLVSSAVTSAVDTTHFDALAAGAVDVVEKPDVRLLTGDKRTRRKFLENLKAMAGVVTLTRRGDSRRSSQPPRGSDRPELTDPELPPGFPSEAKLIVLGASTGGPPAVAETLRRLERSAAPPVVLVQHMANGFIHGFAEWLGGRLSLEVRLAANGERVAPGTVYVAPDDQHLEVTQYGRLLVSRAPPLRYHRPSIDLLFRSASTYGKHAVGVLLTGMGDDGARGLGAMRRAGAFTLAQDEKSSVVYGMPAAAAARGAVSWASDCGRISKVLRKLRFQSQTLVVGES